MKETFEHCLSVISLKITERWALWRFGYEHEFWYLHPCFKIQAPYRYVVTETECCAMYPCPGPRVTKTSWELPWGMMKYLPHRVATFNSLNLETEVNPKRLGDNLIVTPGFPYLATVLKPLLWKEQWLQANKQDILSVIFRRKSAVSMHFA